MTGDPTGAYTIDGPDPTWSGNGSNCFSGHTPGTYTASAADATISPASATLTAGATITFDIAFGGPPPATGVCNPADYGPDPGNPIDDRPDDAAIQYCLDRFSVVVLDPGTPGYIINGVFSHGDDHGQGLVIRQNGTIIKSSAGATTRATIIAGRDLFGHILETAAGGVSDFVIQDIRFDGMVDCVPGNSDSCSPLVAPPTDGAWRRHRDDCYDDGGVHNAGNLQLEGIRYRFTHNESKHAMCGSGLGLLGRFYHVEDNYIAFNGRDQFALPNRTCLVTKPDGTCKYYDAPWSDGITSLSCDGGEIWKNVLVDNTDIDLVVGGGSSCSVLDNTIWHGGKYAFAGLDIGNFNNSGVHTGSQFSGNKITNTVVNEDAPGKFVPRLGIGLLVGSHPWSQNAIFDVKDTGTVGSSSPIAGRPDVDVGPNVISGANANLVVDGVCAIRCPSTILGKPDARLKIAKAETPDASFQVRRRRDPTPPRDRRNRRASWTSEARRASAGTSTPPGSASSATDQSV